MLISNILKKLRRQDKVDKELFFSEERLAVATRAAGIGVFDWFVKVDELYWNKQQFILFNFSEDKFKGSFQDWLQCVLPEDRETATARFTDALHNHNSYLGEYRIKRPGDGAIRIIQSHAQIYRDSAGEPYRAVGINRDVTHERAIERELGESQKKAEEAMRVTSSFLANMSHEIRTPMNAITAMAELALEHQMSSEARENIETVLQSSEYLLELLNDVLDYSKIEATQVDFSNEPVDIKNLLQSVVEMYRTKSQSKNIYLNFNLGEQLPQFILGDSLRMKQVLTNLLSNAIKFTPVQGQIEVIADTIENGKTLQILVSDTGIGIAQDKWSLIFEPFRQVDSSTTRQYGGTGLGLSISKKIAELVGGKLYFESKENQGTTFFFEMPCVAVSGDVRPKSSNNSIPTVKRDLNEIRILVAEDNLVNQKVVMQILKRYNVQPTLVDNGEKIIELLAEGQVFDLILMDCQMPVMNGYEATREIRFRQSEAEARTVIIAMTANAQEGDREICLDSGMDDYIPKPIRSAQFEELLYQWCDVILSAR